jgi:hypothetical protein
MTSEDVMKNILKIWESRNKEDILKLQDELPYGNIPFRIVSLLPREVEPYFKNYRRNDGYKRHATYYDWNGKLYLLEARIKKRKAPRYLPA